MNDTIEPLYDKSCACMVCGHSFTTKRIRSRFVKVKKLHNDFFTEYKEVDLNPSYYEAAVCPECGFTFTDMFQPSFPPGSSDAIREVLKSWKKQNFGEQRTRSDAIRTMKLALLSAVLKKEKHIVIAGLCLRLAWVYRELRSSELSSNKLPQSEEKRFLEQALERYIASYEQADYVGTQMSDIRILYLIGELSRQLGNQADGIRYFSEVIHHKNRAVETKLVEMAREQWYIMRQGIKDVASQ
ncbi:DUF2225 domain-containing protein [Alkalihalophilus marmarensis]|uniref:DUF2225 domain-containing protein n=1 Tax=Alkalihalophilus marmarensis DSM 21297 TaxID=1188261 RepID=U6SHA1_9BACI|nr:DUF2225 domain-containing protein [Alkalihalophilus marmarensis]ERN51104.1 hypothetical protein A33I_02860 [Alkalihalophilus marmarensis DSM 21297]MCM3491383.1 DUF2225 domain-containing protein [Alkalihalophilus marmarensis]